jgi:hypothetical protein
VRTLNISQERQLFRYCAILGQRHLTYNVFISTAQNPTAIFCARVCIFRHVLTVFREEHMSSLIMFTASSMNMARALLKFSNKNCPEQIKVFKKHVLQPKECAAVVINVKLMCKFLYPHKLCGYT